MFQFSKYPMDILEMLSGHQAHQFKGLGLERPLSHQQQVPLPHQGQLQTQHPPTSEASGGLLSGLGLSSLPSPRTNAFSDSSSLFTKMGAPPPPPPPPMAHQSPSSSSHGSRKVSKLSGGASSPGYPQFLRPFHPAEALAQEQLHSGMSRFDFGGGGGVTPAPPPPLHPGLPQPPPASSSPSTSVTSNPSGSTVPLQSDPRSLHQQFSCMLAANQYFLSGVPSNSGLEQFLVQPGSHNPLGLGLGQSSESNAALAPPPLHSAHSHSSPQPPPQQQLTPHVLPHGHAHHPLHPAPQAPPLGGFDFQGIPVLSSNQIASLMQQEAGLPLHLPLHLSLSKDEAKADGTAPSGGSRRKKAMAGYLPQRKADAHNSSCHEGGAGALGAEPVLEPQHTPLLSPSSSAPSSSSSSSVAPSSSSSSAHVANGNPKAPPSSEPESLYHCGECGKTFTHLSSLRRHLRSHGLTPDSGRRSDCTSPSPERIFCCGECGKRFKKRGHLIQHSVTHSENRPFVCAVCQKSFNRRESLTRHEKIHDEKPFRCPACGRCFRESTSLLNHAASGACGKPPRGSGGKGKSDGDGQPHGSVSQAHSNVNQPHSSINQNHGSVNQPHTDINQPHNNPNQPHGNVSHAHSNVNQSHGGANQPHSNVNQPHSNVNQPHGGIKLEGSEAHEPLGLGADFSRGRYAAYGGGVDEYRRPPQPLYGDALGSDLSNQTLRKAPLAPTLHPHPQSQAPPPQPHLPLSSLLDDSEDEVTSSAMSAIAAAAAASCDMSGEGREGERRDIIGGLLGGLGFGTLGPSSSSTMNGTTLPLSHQNHPPLKPRRPRKPREKREGGLLRRRRSPLPPSDNSDRPYGCQICGKCFRRAETLRRHHRIHTGEKPHTCDVCGKNFREPFHLTKHLTVHSGVKNYKCNLCGKLFAYAQSLVRHGKLHRRGEIDSQGRRIKGAAALKAGGDTDFYSSCSQEEKSPTSGTPSQRIYTCTVCWKSFRHYFHLTAHTQTVHGGGVGLEKNYRCEVCGKAFAYSNSLVRHKLSQHGQKAPPPQQHGYSPLYYDSAYAGSSHMPPDQAPPPPALQHFHVPLGQTTRRRRRKRRVVIHSIMRDGKLVGVPLSKETKRKLLLLRRKRGRAQAQINRKKLLSQLRLRRGLRVKAWRGGAVRVSGLSSLNLSVRRFPCPVCPSSTFLRPGQLRLHYAVRHPPRSSGAARLSCPVCGRQARSLLRALKHRAAHLRQPSSQCLRCQHRFWSPRLLARHKYCCRGVAATAHWGALVNLKTSPQHQDTTPLPLPQLVAPDFAH